jgi:hypothetical protein
MDTDELEKWEKEEDRVQFFRAEAEYERWREQLEIKHAEAHRCMRYFEYFNKVWLELAGAAGSPAHAAYARRTASLYRELRTRVQKVLAAVGLDALSFLDGKRTLVDLVLAWRRSEEQQYFKDVNYWSVVLVFCPP